MNYYLIAGLFFAVSSVHAADVGVLIKPVPAAPAERVIICVENDQGLCIGPSHAKLTENPEDYIWLTPEYWLWLPDGMRRQCVSFPPKASLIQKLVGHPLFEKLFDAKQTKESRRIWLSFVIKLLVLRLPFCKHDLPIMTYKELLVFFGRSPLGLPSYEQLDAVACYLFSQELLGTLIEIEGAYWSDIVARNCSALDVKAASEMEKYIHSTPYQDVLVPPDSYIKDYPLAVGAQLKWSLYDAAIEVQKKKEALWQLILFAEEGHPEVAVHYLRIIFEWLISKQYVLLPPPLERTSGSSGAGAASGSSDDSTSASDDERGEGERQSEGASYRLVDTVHVLGGTLVSEYKSRLELIKPAFQFHDRRRVRFWQLVFDHLIAMYSELARTYGKHGITYQAEVDLYLIKQTAIIGFMGDNGLIAPEVQKIEKPAVGRCAIL